MKHIFCKILLCAFLCSLLILAIGCQTSLNDPEITPEAQKPTDESESSTDPLPEQTTAPLLGELLPDIGTVLYGKSQADGNVLYIYEQMEEHVLRTIPSERIVLERTRQISAREIGDAVAWFCADHPEAFWFGGSYQYFLIGNSVTELVPAYDFSGEALDEARALLDSAVEEILAGIPEHADSYDKALYLHDTVAARVYYERVGYHQTAYGALVDGRAVCAGYAAAYQLLLQRAGVSAFTVTGISKNPTSPTGQSERHAWNAVWLDDQTCVYTDVTWDDQGDHLFHYYFNLSYQEFRADHTEDETVVLPVCNHEDCSYFDRNSSLVINSTTPISKVAQLFQAVQYGHQSGVLYYDDDQIPFGDWLRDHLWELTLAVFGEPAGLAQRAVNLGNEYHLVLA